MIMAGNKAATLQMVRLIDIHGTRYYDLAYQHDDAPAHIHTARIGVEDSYPDPQPGDQVQVRYLMNVAVGMTRR